MNKNKWKKNKLPAFENKMNIQRLSKTKTKTKKKQKKGCPNKYFRQNVVFYDIEWGLFSFEIILRYGL